MVFWDSSESAEPGRLPPIVDSVQSTRNGSGTRLRQRSRVPEAWRGPPHNKLYGVGPVDSHLVKFNLAIANLAVAIPSIESLILSFNICRISFIASHNVSYNASFSQRISQCLSTQSPATLVTLLTFMKRR